MEHILCWLCGRDETELMFTRRDFAYRISAEAFCVVRCRNCGLVYVNPRPTETEIHDYYTDGFYDVAVAPEQLMREKSRQLQLKFSYVKDLAPGRLLDIGCQKGEFMFYMNQCGWDVFGMEFSEKPPNLFDQRIHYGSLESAEYAAESFDLVTLWAVLEHDYDPLGTLRRVWELLKPGGVVVVLVTNFNSPPARLMRHDDIPRHTTLFTRRTLGRTLRHAGFSKARFEWNSELYGGSNRGILNYLAKLGVGEQIEDIVAVNRSTTRWSEFSSMLHGTPSRLMERIDRWDIALSPRIDRWMDRIHLGFIMLARATKSD